MSPKCRQNTMEQRKHSIRVQLIRKGRKGTEHTLQDKIAGLAADIKGKYSVHQTG